MKGPVFRLGRLGRVASVESNKKTPRIQQQTLKSALLTKLTYQYIIALSCISIAFAPGLIVSYYILSDGADFQNQLGKASERLFYVSQTAYLVREMTLTTNPTISE